MNKVVEAQRRKARLRLSQFFSVTPKTQSAILCPRLKLPDVQRSGFVMFLRTPYLVYRNENYERMLSIQECKERAAEYKRIREYSEQRKRDPFYTFPCEPHCKDLDSMQFTLKERQRYQKFKFDSGDCIRYLKAQFHRLKKEYLAEKRGEPRSTYKKERIYLI